MQKQIVVIYVHVLVLMNFSETSECTFEEICYSVLGSVILHS